ncbi:hypothetical protein PLIP_a0183 [Pseudoalteromonas lipolytica LMEB 39]|nr:hypothetical protein [Pseudoalteromonas lipolytica LMEB 39]
MLKSNKQAIIRTEFISGHQVTACCSPEITGLSKVAVH